MKLGLYLVALLSGAGLAIQVGINYSLRERVENAVLAAWISFAIGTVALTLYLAVRPPVVPPRAVWSTTPVWVWGGGLVGAFYVVSAAAFAGRIGALGWLSLVVTGQVLMSIIMDHFGMVGFPIKHVTPSRIAGACLLLGGVLLILRR